MSDKSTFLDSLNDAIDGVTRFFYPRRCPFCGVGLGRELICDSCRAALPRCDVQLRGAYYGVVSAPLWYTGGVRKALMDLKFRRRMGGLDLFGRLMGECAKQWYDGAFDAVTWVPVSGKRLRKRGFDQSRLLAASLCVDWHTMPQETLRKVVDNPPQSALLGTERRRANVLGVYRPVRPEAIRGKRFLLIDDLMTSGATLAECVRVLREAGAADVVCLTLAITPRE
ncbi:MAG: ComF family protein [Oscillospiraceae bacterium]|nr:ComF family protein [Oscillospiraceae bacterium]